MTYPKVSIVIATHNRCNALKHCLNSILSQSYPKELLELLILDDASTDSTPKEIPEYLKNVNIKKNQYFRNEKNLCIITCRHILGEKVYPESEFVLFLDDDAYLEKDCLKILVEYMIEHKDSGVVGPRIVFAKNPDKTAHSASFVGKWTGRYTEKDSNEPIECDWVNSTCCLVRKSAIEKTGGFYPGFYISHAEADFCLRVKKHGFKVIYNPLTTTQHDVDLSKPKRDRLYYGYRNKMLVINRNFSFIRKIFAFSLILVFGTPKYLLESIRFHKKIVFSELGMIFSSVLDGLTGKTGPK